MPKTTNELDLFAQEESEHLEICWNDQRRLRLRQYSSSDGRWGIYSSVWDGGLGLGAYLLQHPLDYERTCLIDLGAGTGIAGLLVAAMSKGKARVYLTDLEEALELLTLNVAANKHHWTYGRQVHSPSVLKLEWGRLLDNNWVQELVTDAKRDGRRQIVLLGADIIYRVSLFVPLLSTISQLFARIHQLDPKLKVRCLLACHSIRTSLSDFWELAREKQNFAVDLKAVVELPSTQKRLDLRSAEVILMDDRLPEAAPVDPTKVMVVEVRKLPFTFSI